MKKSLFSLVVLGLLLSPGCGNRTSGKTYSPKEENNKVCVLPASSESDGNYIAPKADGQIAIDGEGKEKAWEKAEWKDIKYKWLGEDFSQQDFQGRYKMLWDEGQLYFLVEIVDDILSDQHKDPFDNWWEDDCLELFIDEDRSKGEHQYNHNAFAYHITLDYDVVDMGPDKQPHLYNNDLKVKRTGKGNLYTWEVAMKVFPDSYKDGGQNTPVKLKAGKKLGFAVSYNDNDATGGRENFIGSIKIEPVNGDTNRGWIDAGVFGELTLVE